MVIGGTELLAGGCIPGPHDSAFVLSRFRRRDDEHGEYMSCVMVDGRQVPGNQPYDAPHLSLECFAGVPDPDEPEADNRAFTMGVNLTKGNPHPLMLRLYPDEHVSVVVNVATDGGQDHVTLSLGVLTDFARAYRKATSNQE